MAVQIKFKSASAQKRWAELHDEKVVLQGKKQTASNEGKIEIINCLMTACKVGFNLTEARVKKVARFLKEELGEKKVRYGAIPDGVSPNSILYKDIVIIYTEKDGVIVFRENQNP